MRWRKLLAFAIIDATFYADTLVKYWIEGIRTPQSDILFKALTELGSPYAFILLGVLAVVILCKGGHLRVAQVLSVGMMLGWAMMKLLKDLIGRERPAGEQLTIATGMRFPSGHAMLSLVFYGNIAYLLLQHGKSRDQRIAAYGLMLLIGLIGFSRVYLNVHYASDVAAGFVIAGLILAVMIRLSKPR